MKFVCLQEAFKGYFLSIPDSDTAQLRACGFWNIRHYLRLGTTGALVRAATRYWDPKENLFRFNKQEMCPLIEEFSVMMGIQFTRQTKVAHPCPYVGPQARLFNQFNLEEAEKRFIFKQQGADMEVVLSVLRNMSPRDPRWVPLVHLMILGCFLCEQPSGFCCYRLVSLISQIDEGRSPFPVILAETLIRLDAAHSGRPEEGGSPTLLTFWLLEKMGMTLDYVGKKKFNPGSIQARVKKGGPQFEVSTSVWSERLHDLEEDTVRWLSPWWDIREVLIQTGDSGVLLFGLYRFIWYRPKRFARQYGQRQYIPDPESGLSSSHPYSEGSLDFYIRRNPGDFQYACVDPRQEFPITTPDDYQSWITAVCQGGQAQASKRRRTE